MEQTSVQAQIEEKEECKGILQGLDMKIGETNGKAWTRYTYVLSLPNGSREWFSSFENLSKDLELGKEYVVVFTKVVSPKVNPNTGMPYVNKNVVSITSFSSLSVTAQGMNPREIEFVNQYSELDLFVDADIFRTVTVDKLGVGGERADYLYGYYKVLKGF